MVPYPRRRPIASLPAKAGRGSTQALLLGGLLFLCGGLRRFLGWLGGGRRGRPRGLGAARARRIAGGRAGRSLGGGLGGRLGRLALRPAAGAGARIDELDR